MPAPIALLIGAGIVLGLLSVNGDSGPSEAEAVCEQWIIDRLRAPAMVDFPGATTVTPDGEDWWAAATSSVGGR